MIKSKKALISIVVVVIMTITACSNTKTNEDTKVKEAATEALNAMEHGDIVGRTDVFDLQTINDLSKGYPGFSDFKIDSVQDDSKTMKDTYSVYATITYNNGKSEPYFILMQKRDGSWKLAAMATAEQYKAMQKE